VKFLVDAQLPPALAQWLREAGHEAEAVRIVGLRDAEDDAIWQYGLTSGSVIVTKDEDFPTRLQQTTVSPQILWLRVGNTSNRALKNWFIPQIPQVVELLNQGVRLVEVR